MPSGLLDDLADQAGHVGPADDVVLARALAAISRLEGTIAVALYVAFVAITVVRG